MERTKRGMAAVDDFGLDSPFEASPSGEETARAALEVLGESPFATGEQADEAERPEEAYEQLEAADANEAAAGRLARGSRGPAVATLQRSLMQLGHAVAVDGDFGPGTESAVRAFQSRAGIAPDGAVGPRTAAAIAGALGGAAPAASPAAPAARAGGPTFAGRLVVESHPMLRAHRGTPPDLVLRWNRLGESAGVDVVVHFHGYSGRGAAMRIDRDKEPHSGLDFADPERSGAPGRGRPTLAILPRGNHFGGRSGAGYDFPALVRPGALQALVQDALARAGREVGHALHLERLILTGHSGGGAPVSAVLAHVDPDEVHVFDGTYGAGTNIVRWAQRRIARELASPAAVPPALRVLYRPRTQTAEHAEAIAREVCAALAAAAAARLRPYFRVDATPVAHNDIPGRFGWRLLTDPAGELPGAKTLACADATARESSDEREQDEASPFWEAAPTEREESAQEAITMSEPRNLEGIEPFGSLGEDPAREERDGEALAWLDMEAEADSREEPPRDALETGDELRAQWSEDEQEEDTEAPERFDELDHEGDAEWTSEEPGREGETVVLGVDREDETVVLGVEREEEASLATSGLTAAERKAVEITSTLETGKRGGFYGLSGNFDGQGLSFGLVNWTIGTGSLQPLLRDFATEHPQRWNAVFGDDAARLLGVITPTGEAARKEQHRFAIEQMNSSTVRDGKRRWAIREPWVTYFKRLSEDEEFRRIQLRYVRDLLSRAEYFCRYFKLKSEAAFAFMFDAVSSHGKKWLTKKIRGKQRRRLLLRERLEALARQHGEGRIPEKDILLAIADVLGATSAPRWADKVRRRKRWFVTGEHPRAKELRGLEPRLDVPYATSPASGETAEEFEPPYVSEDEDQQSEMTVLEGLLEAEAGAGTGLAERVKGVAAFVLGPTLQRGSTGPAVATLQRCLSQLGYPVTDNGNFGPGTDKAVRAFQSRSGITPDGVVGPRTKAAIAAAVGGGAQPSPAPVPPPTPSTSGLGDAIARIAEQEYRRWHPPSGKLRETDRAAVPILQQYYREGVNLNVRAAELQDAAWQKAHPWSAVFVSWVMRTAGAGSAFRYSAAHQSYVAAARRNRLEGHASNPFWAHRATEVAPEVGDLICASRQDSGATYDNIADPKARATHCDIVTEVRPGSLRVIGGNVNQNVDEKRIRTLPDGRLALDGKQSRFFAVVRCRGPVGAAAPQPRPQPPAPPEPASSPVPTGQQLTPPQFVATFGASARASQAANGVPALVTLGQAALESGWGKHAPRFNFFGIKAKASDPESSRQLLRTREVLPHRNGKFPEVISITPRPDGKFEYVVRDWFRAFPDAATAFNAHGEFLVRNKRYARAFQVAHDPYAFAAEVARAKYATDPNYESVLKGVMRKIEAVGGGVSHEQFEAA